MTDSLQIDARFPEVISRFPSTISRRDDLGDSIMTAIVLAPFAREAKAFTELGRLRVQECERVEALKTELQKCGGSVIEDGDTLRVHPGPLNGAIIETYKLPSATLLPPVAASGTLLVLSRNGDLSAYRTGK